MKKMLFIYNPKAGKAQIRNKLADILDVFTKGGYEITVYPTQRSEDAMEKTEKRSKDYDIVVCSGGDGTLDEVVTGMIRSGFRTPIGYIPAGSTNDFGGSLGLPKNMDGTEGPRAEKSRAVAHLLTEATGLEVVLWDERRSSIEAHGILHANGRKEKKHRRTVDAVAASLILEGYLGTLR